nr:X-ray radiation resistance-associated protein 1 [Pelodiscus sinensis]|eukprot:XP_014431179.1 X-ray radiation resistance-associated protein 1 [Pelodiscus sinensis]
MATLYKLDNGKSYATNCFPARNILRTSEEGAGHWLVAHRAAQKTTFEAVICAKSLQEKVQTTPQYVSELQHHGYTDETVQENILDGPFLIQLHCVKIPSDLCSVDISNKNLVSAKEDDFEQFDSVAYINATENLLTLEAFRNFSGLRELELSLNGLRNIKISAGDFLHLEILDLSYNNLSPEDVRTLGVLSQLKVLHLTANGLRSLPSDLADSEQDGTSSRFPSLEVLLLDDNDLSHPSVFVSLANLRSLKQLNLDKNGISEVPYLHQMENSRFSLHPRSAKMDPSRLGQKHEQLLQGAAGLQRKLVMEEEPLEHMVLQNTPDPDGTEEAYTSVSQEPPLLDVFMEGNDRSCRADSRTLPASFRNPSSKEFVLPLPELRYLSLANNKIKNEEDLLAVPQQPPHHPPKRYSTSLTPRVTSHVPKVPKQPLMLEAPLESFFWKLWSDTEGGKPEESEEGSYMFSPSDPLPPIRPSSAQRHQEPSDDAKTLGSWREVLEEDSCNPKLAPDSSGDDMGLFFLTQVREHVPCVCRVLSSLTCEFVSELDDADDIPNSVWRHELQDRQGKRKNKPKSPDSCTYIPAKYKGYEELLHVKTDPDFTEPVGMQQNVQALRRALKQPLVYRDSKARLDSVQKPYVPRKKKLGKPPGSPSRKTKVEVLEDVLLAMRGNMNITEVPLVSVLRQKRSNRKAYQEALGLMKEFHKQYKAALAASSKGICKERGAIPELGQSFPQEPFVELKESKQVSLPEDTKENLSLLHCPPETRSSPRRSIVTFAL